MESCSFQAEVYAVGLSAPRPGSTCCATGRPGCGLTVFAPPIASQMVVVRLPTKQKTPPSVGGLRDESELVALVDDGGSRKITRSLWHGPSRGGNRVSTW